MASLAIVAKLTKNIICGAMYRIKIAVLTENAVENVVH